MQPGVGVRGTEQHLAIGIRRIVEAGEIITLDRTNGRRQSGRPRESRHSGQVGNGDQCARRGSAEIHTDAEQ